MIKREVLKRMKAHFKEHPDLESVSIEHGQSCRSECEFCLAYAMGMAIARNPIKRYHLDFFGRMPILMDTFIGLHTIRHEFKNEKLIISKRKERIKKYTWKA